LGLPTDCPEEEPGTACVGIVPGGVGLVAECVIREGLEWGWCQWVVLVRSGSAAGHGRLKLGESALLEMYRVQQVGKKA
jgi:hypothetical protein